MANVYSLICWGGKNGKATTSINSTTDTLTIANHGLRDGTGLKAQSAVNGLNTTDTYYAKSTGASTFTLHPTSADAIAGTNTVNLTGTTNLTFKSAYYAGLADKSRWTVSGTEYIFDSLNAWEVHRSATIPASSLDTEVCEIGMGWSDYNAAILIINVPAAQTIITTEVDGTRSNAFHNGIYPPATPTIDSGYILLGGVGIGGGVSVSSPNLTMDGFAVNPTSGGSYAVRSAALKTTWRNMILYSASIGSATTGVLFTSNSVGSVVERCIVKGFVTGIKTAGFTSHSVSNCLATGCTTGFGTDGSSVRGSYYNNVSIGNTTNWGTATIDTDPLLAQASHNAGLVGEAWLTGVNPRFTIATTDFANYAGDNYRPALETAGSTTSPQVSVGVSYYGIPATDLADDETPAYPGNAVGTIVTAGSFVNGLSYTIATKGTTDFTAIGATTNAVTFTAATDLVNWTAHTLNNGDLIYFSAITSNTGVVIDTMYYVISKLANSFQVSLTAGGSAVNITGVDAGGTVVLPTFKATGVGTGTGTATLNAKVTLGPYEADLGYGPTPLQRDLDLSGIVTGSQVVVYSTGTTTVLAGPTTTAGTTFSYSAGTSGVTVDYTVYKLGYDPIRITGIALDATSTTATIQQVANRAWVASSGLTYSTDLLYTVGSPNTLKLRIASTWQNAACCLYEAFIDAATNTALKNIDFPIASFGDTSFTLITGAEFRGWTTAGTAISNSSINFLSRDGLRYSSDDGTTTTAQWAAVRTLNTPAGQQVKYQQVASGAITAALNTGPMDQLVQVYGNASYGNFDYRGFMTLRAPKVGWSQPKPDLVATYGNLSDGFYVAALEPVLQYATTDADIDAANLVLNNTTKTFTVTASHTMLELYQRAQWWANQDAQWDADIPLTTTDGSTFTQPSTWTLSGTAFLTDGTLSGGTAVLAAGTQTISFAAITMSMGAAGTYTFTMAGSSVASMTPTAPGTYNFADSTFVGTVDLRNTSGTHAITVELPSGTAYTTANNTGAAITVTFPVITADISITSMPNAVGAYNRLQIINQTALTAAARANSTAYTLGAIRLRQTGIGTENTAGLYLRCTTAGTSAGSPPTWNTTPGGTTTDGTVVWTTYKVLYYDADPAGTSLTDSYIDGEEFLAGETAEIRFSEMDAGTSRKIYDTTAVVATTGFSALVSTDADGPFATIGIDGSTQESTFSPNYTSDRLTLDSNTDFSGVGAYAYYCYLLTTSEGMYNFWGGVTALDEANFRINTAILDMYFDETNGFVKQTDNVRWFRDDGLRPAVDPTTGGSGIEINWRTPVSVISVGGSALTPTQDAKLMAIPAADTNASATRTELSTELARITKLAKLSGIDATLVVTPTARSAGDITQTVTTVGDTTTVATV